MIRDPATGDTILFGAETDPVYDVTVCWSFDFEPMVMRFNSYEEAREYFAKITKERECRVTLSPDHYDKNPSHVKLSKTFDKEGNMTYEVDDE